MTESNEADTTAEQPEPQGPTETGDMADVAPLEPPADDEPTDETPAEPEPADDGNKTPRTAELDPPAPKQEPVRQYRPPTPIDAAADRLREVTEQTFYITTADGAQPNPETVFQPRGDGSFTAMERLHQHGTATKHDRPVVTLLIAKGAAVSEKAAAIITAQIKSQAENDEPDEDPDQD